LSFAAGYVDACTFLALFGLYVAQVTGSFVVFGAGLVAGDEGFLIKVLAIPVFFAAGVFTTIVSEVLRRRGHAPLVWALALECLLIAGLLVLGVVVPFHEDPNAPLTLTAAMLGLSAMGVQSAAVRLLLPGVASTNVMTTTPRWSRSRRRRPPPPGSRRAGLPPTPTPRKSSSPRATGCSTSRRSASDFSPEPSPAPAPICWRASGACCSRPRSWRD